MTSIDAFFNTTKDFEDSFEEEDDILVTQEQLINNKYQAQLEEDIDFKKR